MFRQMKEMLSVWMMEHFPRWRMYNLLRHKRRDLISRPARVMFLVNDAAKWKCQSVFDAMVSDGLFEPKIALTVQRTHDMQVPQTAAEKMASLHAFFNSRGMQDYVVDAFDVKTNTYLDLRQFTPDIIFYQQPWGIAHIQSLERTSFFALPCYVPYFSPNNGDFALDCRRDFHYLLWRYYVGNEEWARVYAGAMRQPRPLGKLVGAGHPIFDELQAYAKKHCESWKSYVIYAPHFSLPLPGNPNGTRYSTFHKNGAEILAYAQKHTEFKWVFKPHPLLREAILKTGFMTEAQVNDYYTSWEKLGAACYDANYMDLFFQARAMITDSASFLSEFACTGMPIIHLLSPGAKVHPMPPNKALYGTYYQVHNETEMREFFSKVLEQRQDPNRGARLKELDKCGYMRQQATKNIICDLKSQLWPKTSLANSDRGDL